MLALFVYLRDCVGIYSIGFKGYHTVGREKQVSVPRATLFIHF